MKFPRYILILFVCLQLTPLFAQTKKIDSLIRSIHTATDPDDRLSLYLSLFEHHQSIEKDSLLQYVLRASNLAARNASSSSESIKKGWITIAYINTLLRFEQTDSARRLVETEIKKYSPDHQQERALYFDLAALKSDCYNTETNYKEAAAILYNTINLAEKYKDTLTLTRSYNSLGEIAYNRDMIGEAKQWHYRVLSLVNGRTKYEAQSAVAYINLGIIYNWTEKLDSAQYCVDRSIPLAASVENLYYLCNAYMVLATNYRHLQNYVAAEKWMLKAIDIRQKTEGRIVFSNEQLALGNLYFRSGQYNKSIQVFKDGLAYDDSLQHTKGAANNSKSNLVVKLYYYQGLARCYKATHQLALYGAMLEKFISLQDTLQQINASDAMADMQVKYETQKKENTIIQQKLDLNRKNILLYGSLGLLAALAVIFAILFWSYKSRQELKLQQQIEEDKWLTQQEVAKAEEKERNRIAADLHDNLGVYAASIASNLNHIQLDLQNESNSTALNELRKNSQAIVSQLNDTIWVLKKESILLTAIGDRIKLLINRTQKSFPQIQFNVTEDVETDIEFSASHAYHLYRIMQEAINNALKHSQCTQINIDINSHQTWTVRIKDNGTGLHISDNVTEGGNGLKNMETRGAEAGWLVQWETGQSGTSVIISPTTN